MGSPYRESGLVPDEILEDAEQPLATVDVSGRDGARGADGAAGANGSSSGSDGGDGRDAGPAEPGETAGSIRVTLAERDGVVVLEGKCVDARRSEGAVHQTIAVGERGFVELRAIGGRGGDGGHGGRGGDGATGSDGSDATRWSSGSNGGSGGDGGDGGNGTSGAGGGSGGSIVVACSDADTPLLMLVREDIRGGKGGAVGANGAGGSGGAGGDGGDSYSWTESESYTDSNGDTQTRTTWHHNSGGSDGTSGSSGSTGTARLRSGADGANGTYAIEVRVGDRVETYPSRYDLRLEGFAHENANEDAVYEPGEIVRVFDLEVENAGGMPTPSSDELALTLVAGGWVVPEPGELFCVKSLAPGARHRVAGELRFRIRDFTPKEPGDPLEVEESILHRAMLPSVRRAFEDYQRGDAIDAGKFTIRFPARVSTVSSLRSLAAGEATRVRLTVVNQSRFALGAASEGKRVLRARVVRDDDSELGDEHVVFAVDGARVAPATGHAFELPLLGAGEAKDLELAVEIRADAPEYRRFAARVVLELGRLDAPAEAKPIQLRGFDIRVARPFQPTEAELLLVVNHRTTREEVEAWEALAKRLSFQTAIWDLSRERHLDLEAPVANGASLAELFANKAIAILDNAIDGPDGELRPHELVCTYQALRAAHAGIDLAFFGRGPTLDRMMVPAGDDKLALVQAPAQSAAELVEIARVEPRASVSVHRRYWLRFWARPDERWLASRANGLAERIAAAIPSQRHLVVQRFAPKVVSKFLWIKKWHVGTLETLRTLDVASGGIVRVELTDEDLPSYPRKPDAVSALLLVFGFAENLERFAWVARSTDADEATLDRMADVMLLDLANELAAVASPGWRDGASSTELLAALPRLQALANAGLALEFDSIAGGALLRLAGRLRYFADAQVGMFEKLPPFRWLRRTPALSALVEDHVDKLLASTFSPEQLVAARREIERIAGALETAFHDAKRAHRTHDRAVWALDLLRAPIAATTITSDTEILATAHERVLSEREHDDIASGKAEAARRRAAIVASADLQHRELRV